MMDKFPIGLRGLNNRHDIVFSQALSTLVTSFVLKLSQCLTQPSFMAQLVDVGFLMHWESLLSTMGDELGMLDDFIVAIHDLNNVKFKVSPVRGKPCFVHSGMAECWNVCFTLIVQHSHASKFIPCFVPGIIIRMCVFYISSVFICTKYSPNAQSSIFILEYNYV